MARSLSTRFTSPVSPDSPSPGDTSITLACAAQSDQVSQSRRPGTPNAPVSQAKHEARPPHAVSPQNRRTKHRPVYAPCAKHAPPAALKPAQDVSTNGRFTCHARSASASQTLTSASAQALTTRWSAAVVHPPPCGSASPAVTIAYGVVIR